MRPIWGDRRATGASTLAGLNARLRAGIPKPTPLAPDGAGQPSNEGGECRDVDGRRGSDRRRREPPTRLPGGTPNACTEFKEANFTNTAIAGNVRSFVTIQNVFPDARQAMTSKHHPMMVAHLACLIRSLNEPPGMARFDCTGRIAGPKWSPRSRRARTARRLVTVTSVRQPKSRAGRQIVGRGHALAVGLVDARVFDAGAVERHRQLP